MNHYCKMTEGIMKAGCITAFILSSLVHLPPTFAESPTWWVTRSVIDTNAAVNDYAPAVAGQLKWIADKAQDELDENLVGGAGTGINAVVNGFLNFGDLGPVVLGQLKKVAHPFHDRLVEVGYETNYPWTVTTSDDDDFAPALLGQVKYVFDFNVTPDSDGDGMPDWWEQLYFGGPTNGTATADSDSDGLNNLEEFQNGAAPNDTDSDDDTLSDYDEVNTYGTSPVLADTDGDGLNDYSELFTYGTIPTSRDSDNDGRDDNFELSFGLNPTNAQAATGINSNWVFHSRSSFSSATWELVPDNWTRFLSVDYDAGTNTAFIFLPQQLGLDPNCTTQVLLRYSWRAITNWASYDYTSTSWTNVEYSGTFVTDVVITADSPFHGIPTYGESTVLLYRFDWPIPDIVSTGTIEAYYAPLLRVLTNSQQSGYFWVLDNIDSSEAGYGYNNYLVGAQAVGPQFGDRDFRADLDKLRFRNSNFETGISSSHTNLPFWQGFGDTGGISTSIVHGGSRAFVSRDLDGVYQHVVVHPGEEIELGGWLYTPSITNSLDTNSLTGDRYPIISIEYYDVTDASLVRLDAAQISASAQEDAWHYCSITSLVPDRVGYAQISLRIVAPTLDLVPPGSAYFDDIYFAVNPDTDRDGVPDRWEALWPSIMSTNDPADSIEDADTDGLANIDEYRLGTRPDLTDTDGDGISDTLEHNYGMDPNDPSDAQLDSDGDGLANATEVQLGTSPFRFDSDNDGLDDATEALDYGSDPTQDDFDGFTQIYQIPGTSTVSRVGTWIEDGDYLCCSGLRGSASYLLTVPSNDIYRIEIEAGDCASWKTLQAYEISATLNELYLGRSQLYTGTNGVGSAGFFSPYLTAGVYTVCFEWDNASKTRNLNIHAIHLSYLSDDDSDSDGQKDWVKTRLSRLSGPDLNAVTSSVSPACIEGRNPYIELMSIEGGIEAKRGVNGRWYADLPLNAGEAADYWMEFQNGGLIATCTVTWAATDVLETDETMVIRTNDSLKLTAFLASATSGTYDVSVVGVTNASGIEVTNYFIYTFVSTGTYQVTGTYYPVSGPTLTGSFTVEVFSASFSTSPVCWMLVERSWYCPDLPSNVVLETGIDFMINEDDYGSPRTFDLTAMTPEEHGIVARLGTNGSIIASVEARGFRFAADSDTGFSELGRCSTGIILYENPFVMSPILEDIEIHGSIIKSGVFYEDSTITNYWDSEDFDETGVMNVRFLMDYEGAFCNEKELYQGTTLIGRHSSP